MACVLHQTSAHALWDGLVRAAQMPYVQLAAKMARAPMLLEHANATLATLALSVTKQIVLMVAVMVLAPPLALATVIPAFSIQNATSISIAITRSREATGHWSVM